MKFLTKMREKAIINEIKEKMQDTSLLKGLSLNGVKSRACALMMKGKISESFYVSVFYVDEKYHGESYWRVEPNLEFIYNYK